MLDLISFGDTAIDHFCQINDAHLEKAKDLQKELCLNFGSKLPVQIYKQILGGNNGNNAVGAARLGLKAALCANIGDDPAGKITLEGLKKEKVDVRYVKVNPGLGTNVSVLINYKGERTILVYQNHWDYKLPDLEPARWVYLSSMAESFKDSPVVDQLESFIERSGAKVVFNPGTYQLEPGLKRFNKLLALTTLLIVNKEEAEQVLKADPGREVKKLLRGLSELGPKMVVITDGKEGSFGFDGEKYYKLGVFPAVVADMTGAGDAYAAGVLAGLMHGKDLTEALRWGAANGASVVQYIGAQEGLLNYDKMQEVLKENNKITVKELR